MSEHAHAPNSLSGACWDNMRHRLVSVAGTGFDASQTASSLKHRVRHVAVIKCQGASCRMP